MIIIILRYYTNNLYLSDESTSDFTLSADWEEPPEYKQAEKFPVCLSLFFYPTPLVDSCLFYFSPLQAAAQRSLPKIIPVYPTLRRIMQAASLQRDQRLSHSSELPEEISPSEGQPRNLRAK